MSTTNFKSLAHPAESISLGLLQGPVHPEFIRAEVLADLFEASADRCPEKVALRAGDRGVTYAQLNNLADWAASRLIQSSVRPGHLVGLCLPRGVELLVMQLAIAKTGAGWLPLDSETPPDRIKTCLNDASAFGIVSSSAHLPRLNGLSISIWLAEQLLEPATESEVLRRRQGAMPHHPAYVIYTSGSTGKPKGICIQQGSICHFCQVRLLRAALSERLQPYMVPGRFEILSEMPRLTSGKIDRKALKARPLEACPLAEASEGPETPTEAALLKALAPLFSGQIIQRDFDFFSDLGGHSLLAARWVSALRQVPGLAHATVRDVYQHRTIQAIAAALQSSEPDNRPSLSLQDQPVPGVWRRWRCGLAQAAMLPPLIALRMAQWLAPFFTYHFLTGNPGDSIFYAITLSVLVFLLVTVLEFGIAIVGKWLIAGRLKPGRYPLWGLTYFRWWLSDRLIEAAPVYFISGSSLHAWWLRSLGAKIG